MLGLYVMIAMHKKRGLEFRNGKARNSGKLIILQGMGISHQDIFSETGTIKVQDEPVRSETEPQASRSEYK